MSHDGKRTFMSLYKYYLMAFALTLFVGLLVGCSSGGNSGGGSPTSDKYTLTMAVDPSNSGSVMPASGSQFTQNSVAYLYYYPASGYVFSHWGGVNGSQVLTQNNTLVMNGNKSVTAVFAPVSYNINVSVSGQGTVTQQLVASTQVRYGNNDQVQLTAVPASGWNFDHWTGDLTGTTNPATITVNSTKNIIAYFTTDSGPGALTLASVPNGGAITALGNYSSRQIFLSANVLDGTEETFADQTQTDTSLRSTITVNTVTTSNLVLPSLRVARSASAAPSRLIKRMTVQKASPQMHADAIMHDRGHTLMQNKALLRSVRGTRAITAPVVGSQHSFNVDLSVSGDTTVAATCKKVGTHCYIFVDNKKLTDPFLTNTVIDSLANFFDTTAYPTDTSTFDNPTDTDGDPKIYILATPLERSSTGYLAGYFNPYDKAPSSGGYQSNQLDMFYVTVPTSTAEVQAIDVVLAHEFQHMINFDRHVANNASDVEMSWLDESLSELATFVCTGQVDNNIGYYLSGYATSLTIWDYYNTNGNLYMNYTGSCLFSLYLHDRFYISAGQTGIFKLLENGTVVSRQNVANATGMTFNQLFQDWETALLVSNTAQATSSRFMYQSINLQAGGLSGLRTTPWNVTSLNSQKITVLPYTPYFWSLNNVQSTTGLTISGQNDPGFLVVYP